MNWNLACVIGGGPSCQPVDVSRLKGGVVVGVNGAAHHKACPVYFTNDAGEAIWTEDKVRAFGADAHLSLWDRQRIRFAGWPSTVWKRVASRWPTVEPGQLSSGPEGTPGCSGYVVLNFLMQMGAKTIVLFGYDFHQDYHYFFDEKPHQRREIPGVLESFRRVAPWYERHGIRILNANPGSAVDAFPKISHDEAYRLAS